MDEKEKILHWLKFPQYAKAHLFSFAPSGYTYSLCGKTLRYRKVEKGVSATGEDVKCGLCKRNRNSFYYNTFSVFDAQTTEEKL